MELLLKLGLFLVLLALGYWRGRRNERLHLRWLAEEEKRLADVLIFASHFPPPGAAGLQRMDPVLVSGSVVVAADFFRMLVASLRKVIGGNYAAHERLLERARRHATVKLKQQAQAQGLRMVFNVRYTTARISDPRAGEAMQVEVLAWGTGFVPACGTVAQSRVHHQPGTHITTHDGFDLLKNPVSRWWVIGWFAGLAYIFGELLTDSLWLHSWRYLHGAPWQGFAVAAVVLAALLAHNGRRNQLPWSIGIPLSVLTVPLLVGLFYFAGLRVNGNFAMAWQRDAAPTLYEVRANFEMHPLEPGMPVWQLDPDSAYWETILRPGQQQPILVVRGPLGFYQYDVQPLRERYRQWHMSRQKEKADK